MTGTLLQCTCCYRGEHLAFANTQTGCVEFRKDFHGRKHSLSLALDQIVAILDPHGTSYTSVRA